MKKFKMADVRKGSLYGSQTAEKRRQEVLKRELLVLIHHHLLEAGLVEAAEAMEAGSGLPYNHGSNLYYKYSVCDNIDLPLILNEYLAYYQLRYGWIGHCG